MSFTWKDYTQELKAVVKGWWPTTLVKRLAHRSFYRPSFDEVLTEKRSESTAQMKRTLTGLDLLMFGVGIILGAGVFVITAQVAKDNAGPATIVSYAIAGLSALLSSFCYAEYAVDYPIAGGAFTFISLTYGELCGWITVANLILEYVLANAAVARSFSGYFANLIGKDSSFFAVTPNDSLNLDFWAFGLVLAATALLCYSTRESSTFNLVVTVLHLAVVLFIIIAGLTKASASNMQPFLLDSGARGIFDGAALVFFSYIGFDAVATTAEECKEPAKALPIGIVGSLIVVTTFYILASLTLTLMVPVEAIDASAGFSAAFTYVGLDWAKYIVALGALLGIVTGVLVGALGVARLLTTVGREHMLPSFFAYVHPTLGTPLVSTLFLGIITAIIALFTAFGDLVNLVSICTLFVFWSVANGTLSRRYIAPGHRTWPIIHQVWILISVIGFTVSYQLGASYPGTLVEWLPMCIFLISWFCATLSMHIICRQQYTPSGFAVPLMPWLPSVSIILNTFLLGTIPATAWIQFAIFVAVMVGFYALYSVHAATHADDLRAARTDLPKTVAGKEPGSAGSVEMTKSVN
ncbi:Cationic amino acid transporter 1 [Coccomyxa sp. Obi]|nr:Cationic amino acid transporter 1 [Coccomyxa sp. Obi]